MAGLDLVGALFAKEWAEHGSIRLLVLVAQAYLVLGPSVSQARATAGGAG